jgi:hypothetical protein
MFEHHDVHDNLSQPDSTRPPQLNQTVCGCRCGRGSASVPEGDGGSNEDDGASTCAASDDYNMENDYVSFSGDTALNASFEGHIPDVVPFEYVADLRARVELFVNAVAGFHQTSGIDHPSHVVDYHGILREFDADSMRPEPSSDVHSVVTSDSRSIRPISPGPGIGGWAEEVPEDHRPGIRPLRLTPQHRHCRGLVASHLVLRDEESFDNHFRET